MYERKNQMIFKLGKIQIPLTGEAENFDGTMMLSEHELDLTNSMIQVTNFYVFLSPNIYACHSAFNNKQMEYE